MESSRLVDRPVGQFHARLHRSLRRQDPFAQLLERAERGEEIVITRRGKPVARLVPMGPGHDVDASRSAAGRLRALAEEIDLGPFDWDEWRGYRDAGQR